MIHRFLTLGAAPELRAESATTENDIVPEVEVVLPVEAYWTALDMLRELRYQRHSGQNTAKLTDRLLRLVMLYVVGERERQLLLKDRKALAG